MNPVQRKAIIQEFETYLKSKGYEIQKEVLISKVFASTRKFRFDYVLTDKFSDLTIIEINGGQWVNGRHNRGGVGYENDLTKLNLCALNHISVFQFTYEMLAGLEYKQYIK